MEVGALSLILGKRIAQAPHICPGLLLIFHPLPGYPSMIPWLSEEGGSPKTEVGALSLIFPPSIDSTPHCHCRLTYTTPTRHNCKGLLSSQLLWLLQFTNFCQIVDKHNFKLSLCSWLWQEYGAGTENILFKIRAKFISLANNFCDKGG